jgi:hypothetical protein
MNTKLRISISTLLSFALVYILLDFTTANYFETFVFWSPLLVIGFLLPLSLYSNPCNAVKYNELEQPTLAFKKRSTLRRKMGSYGFISCTVILLFGILILPEPYVKFIIPFLYLAPLFGYLLATNECSFCEKFNAPKEKTCINCGNPLNKTNYIRLKKHI